MSIAKEYAEFFARLNPHAKIDEYEKFFDENSYFEDPFQKVRGVEKIYKIFVDMYEKTHMPRFEIVEVISEESVSYIKWKFFYQLSEKSEQEFFIGVSRVEFNAQNRVLSHVDFWDAGSNVYEKIPLLRWFIKLIKRKLHA